MFTIQNMLVAVQLNDFSWLLCSGVAGADADGEVEMRQMLMLKTSMTIQVR